MKRNILLNYSKKIVPALLALVVTVSLFTGLIPPEPRQALADDEGDFTGLVLPDFSQLGLPEKGNPKLDSALNSLMHQEAPMQIPEDFPGDNTSTENFTEPRMSIMEFDEPVIEETVRVIIECLPGQEEAVIRSATALGNIETSYDNLVQVTVPVSTLNILAEIPEANFIRLPFTPMEFTTTSEGKALIGADDWNTAGYTGTGVKIGILDGGFANYSVMQSQGEVPVPADYRWSPSIGQGTSIHGTACTEIVYDIAPDATYYLVNITTDAEWGAAVDWLIYTCDVDVISCSIGFSAAGPTINSKVAEARAAGVTWCQSAGNSAQSHWYGSWSDSTSNGYLDFIYGSYEFVPVNLNTTTPLQATLRWDDTWGASSNDYDLLLFNSTSFSVSTLVAISAVEQNGNDNPVETIVYTAPTAGIYYLAVGRYSSTLPETLHLFTYPYSFAVSNLMVASRSLCIPGDSPNAITVGAVAYNTPTTIEAFSSQGPTDSGATKPDIVAPDGNTSATYTYATDDSAFYGTSAAAPHTAGAAALVKQHYPSYTPAQVQTYLEVRAVDLGTLKKDNIFGFGRLHLQSTIDFSSFGLDYTVSDALVSSDNQFLFLTDKTGKKLQILRLADNFIETINFNYMPESLAFSPSGQFLYVALLTREHDYFWCEDREGYIAEINVSTHSLVRQFHISEDPYDIAVTSDNVVYVSSGSGTTTTIQSYDLNTLDRIQTKSGIYYRTSLLVDTTEQYLYTMTRGLSPRCITRYSISHGIMTSVAMVFDIQCYVRGDHDQTMAIDPTGSKIFTGYKSVFSAAFNDNDNPIGTLSNYARGFSFDSNNHVYIIDEIYTTDPSDTEGPAFIRKLDNSSYAQQEAYYCPGYGRFVFYTPGNIIGITDGGYTPGKSDVYYFTNNKRLTITTNGNGSTNPPIGSYLYPETTVVSVTATPVMGWTFDHWNGDVTNPTSATTTVIMDTDKNITAVFTEEPVSINVTPSASTLPKGRTQQFTAIGTYSDSSTTNITSTATWTSSNSSVVTISAGGMATAVGEGSANITATYGSISGNTTLTISPAVLDSLVITPDNPTIPKGDTQDFTVTGTYSDATTVDLTDSATWTSSNPAAAVYGGGGPSDVSEFAVSSDSSIVYCIDTLNDKVYKSADAGATWAEITRPAFITQLQFIAAFPGDPDKIAVIGDDIKVAVYDDNTGLWTDWSDMGAISPTALYDISVSAYNGARYIAVAGKSAGGAVLGYIDIDATTPIWVNAVSDGTWSGAPAGQTAINAVAFSTNFQADGCLLALSSKASGGADALVLHLLSFHTSQWDAAIAQFPGWPKVIDTTEGAFIVNKASLALDENFYTGDDSAHIVFVGYAGTDDGTETGGIFRFGTTVAELTASPAAIYSAVFDSTNLFAGSYDSNLIYHYPQACAVTPTLITTAIGPATLNKIKLGVSDTNIMAGTSGDGSFFAVSPSMVTDFQPRSFAESACFFYGLAAGQATITVSFGAFSDTTNLGITEKTLRNIEISPDSGSCFKGLTQQFTVTGLYTDLTTGSITSGITWSSSDTAVARITAAGLATGYAVGSTVITATINGVNDTAALTVKSKIVTGITITPYEGFIGADTSGNQTIQFTASAVYSDGTYSDVTLVATWNISNPLIAANPGFGIFGAIGTGTANVTATYGGDTGQATLTVLSDKVPPYTRIMDPMDGRVFNTPTITVKGFVDASAVSANLTLITNNPAQNIIQAVSGGISETITLQPGTNILRVIAADASGNVGYSNTVIVTLNVLKPNVAVTYPASGNITQETNLTVVGTISGNVTAANLVLNGISHAITVTDGNFNQNVTLTEGKNIIVVNAYAVGHTGESAYLGTSGVITITRDTTPPAISIISPVNGMITSYSGCDVSGTVNDPNVSKVSLTLNETAAVDVPVHNGRFNQRIDLSAGANTIRITATDILGNLSPQAIVTVEFNPAKPVISILSPNNGGLYKTAIRNVTANISDASITTATLVLNGVASTVSVTPAGDYALVNETITLVPGLNTISVSAYAGGHAGESAYLGTSGNITVTLDLTAPVLTIGLTDPVDSIMITVTSNEALNATPSVSVNGTAVTVVSSGINEWQGTYGSFSSPIANGAYTVTVSAYDKALNNKVKNAYFSKHTIDVATDNTTTVQNTSTTIAFSSNTTVTNASVSVTQTLANPSGNVDHPVSANVSIGAFVEIIASPSLRDNLDEVYIEVHYVEADLPADTNESSLRLYLWDVETGTWQLVPGSGVNTDEDFIFGTVPHLSTYGGFGLPTPPQNQGGGGGGGGGGGSGGGGAAAADDKVIFGFGRTITDDGFVYDNYVIESFDALATLYIPYGVIARERSGNALRVFTITNVSTPEPAQEGAILVGNVYQFDPSGATFDPAIPLVIFYYEKYFPEGVTEDMLCVALWDETTGTYIPVDFTIDTQKDKITAYISHFSRYTILAVPKSAEFVLSDLTVTPDEINLNDTVSVSVKVSNQGNISGDYTVTLLIDGTAADTKSVSLAAGEDITVTFSIPANETGTYSVSVGELTGNYSVTAKPASFKLGSLTVSHDNAEIGQEVTISVTASNTGQLTGIYEIKLNIDGKILETKKISLDGGQQQVMNFSFTVKESGKLNIDVNGLLSTLTVNAEATPPENPLLPDENTTPAETIDMIAKDQEPASGLGPGAISGIVIGCIVLAAGVFYSIYRWKQTRKEPDQPLK